MPSDNFSYILRTDFDALTADRETDAFTQKVFHKINSKRRARKGIVGFAAGIGAALAASQFGGTVSAFATAYAGAMMETAGVAIMPQIVATLATGVAILTTAMVLRQEV